MCFSTARLVRHELVGDRLVAVAARDEGEDLELARRQLGERRALGPRARASISASTTFASITEPPCGDGLDRRDQLAAVLDALLEQVRAPVRAAVEQRERRTAAPRTG